MGEHLTEEAARHPACLIETLADLEEAEEYAEGKVREVVVLQWTMSAGMRADGYEEIFRERERLYRTLAWAVRIARRHHAATMGER